MQLYSIGFFFLAQIPLWISRGEKIPNKPAWIYKKNFIIFTKDHSYCRLQYLLLKPRALLMPGPQLSFLMQEHVPWAPGDLHFYQKARGSKWCIVGQGSHPGQHPRHSLQMPHIHTSLIPWPAVRAVAVPRTKCKVGGCRHPRPQPRCHRGCPTFVGLEQHQCN